MVVAGNARFTVLTPRMIRLEWSPTARFEDRASFVFVHRRLPVPRFERREHGGWLEIGTDALALRYRVKGGRFNAKNLSIAFQPRAAGTQGGSSLIPIPERQRGALHSSSPSFSRQVASAPGSQSTSEPAVYNAGSRPTIWHPGRRNRRNLGGTWRTLDEVSGPCRLEPGLLSRDGWTLIDDSRRLLFDDGDWPLPRRLPQSGSDRTAIGKLRSPRRVKGWPWVVPRPDARAIDWYFLAYGTSYVQALQDFAAVAGRVPLPPQYVFGAWWSRYWAYSEAELRDLVREFREHDVPLDVLVVDTDWHLEAWSGYTWNPKYFPDPEGFLRWAASEGLKVALNLHPHEGVGRHEAAFEAMARALGYDPAKIDRIRFDPTDRRFVEAYFRYLHRPLERQGVSFWWLDWQQGKRTNLAGLDPLWWLNYLHWTDQERGRGAKGARPLNFSRWGGLGNHRYPIGFSGDTYSNWRSLAFQPYFTATAGNVCFPYWSHDIGGHFPGPVEPELYARWIQWGALSPVLRTHTTKHPNAERRIWAFDAHIFRVAREAWRLRYHLLPYIYTAARQAYDQALPLCRPLYYHWPELEEAYENPHEYLFGDDLLVAPVARRVSRRTGRAPIKLWFPPGEWVSWFTLERYVGSCEVRLEVPLEQIPLFVRAGATIPAAPPMRHARERPLDPLILHVFAGSGATTHRTRLYEDDGASLGYQRGECRWTPIVCESSARGVRVTIGPAEGSYRGAPEARGCEVRLHKLRAHAETLVDRRSPTPVNERVEFGILPA